MLREGGGPRRQEVCIQGYGSCSWRVLQQPRMGGWGEMGRRRCDLGTGTHTHTHTRIATSKGPPRQHLWPGCMCMCVLNPVKPFRPLLIFLSHPPPFLLFLSLPPPIVTLPSISFLQKISQLSLLSAFCLLTLHVSALL